MLGREPDKHGLFVEKASGEKVGPHRIFAWWGPKRLIDLPGQALFLRKAAGATFPEQHPCQFPRDGASLAGRRSEEDQRQPYGLQRRGHTEAAEEFYRKALSISKEQEAKLWELRAAVSLARLHHDQDRRAEARDVLAPVYGWFTEGFSTPDLKEAKALLNELG